MIDKLLLNASYIAIISLCFLFSLSSAEDFGQLTQNTGQDASGGLEKIQSADQGVSGGFEKYEEYGLAFEYPAEWKVKDESGTSSSGSVTLYKLGLAGISTIFTSTIKIHWDESMANVDPDEFLNLYVELYKQDENYSNVEVEDSSSIIVDGNNAALKVIRIETSDGTQYIDRGVAFTSSNSKRWIRMDYFTPEQLDDETAFNHVVVSFHDTPTKKR